MLRSLNSGVSAMQQFQGELDVIGNNVANSNTVGYKSARVEFADALSQTLQGSSQGSMQIGTGLLTSSISNQFAQGSITRTNNISDLAISGNGFFVVSNPTTGAQFATRAGDFKLDSNGYLVTTSGLRVQGYSDAALTTVGDIQINNTGNPATPASTADVASYTFGKDGTLTVRLTDGVEFTRGQVLLQNFRNPGALLKEGESLYSGFTSAGALAQPVAPGTGGVGELVSSALEMSNVDLANEFSELITTQRAFQASARIISTSDEVLQEVVNLKR
jgi:flagellar hook protein FlgE